MGSCRGRAVNKTSFPNQIMHSATAIAAIGSAGVP
jgi:hypothetical protein